MARRKSKKTETPVELNPVGLVGGFAVPPEFVPKWQLEQAQNDLRYWQLRDAETTFSGVKAAMRSRFIETVKRTGARNANLVGIELGQILDEYVTAALYVAEQRAATQRPL